MKNIVLKIAYDGTSYHGYQEQPGYSTVEGELYKAVESTVGHKVKLYMAGRTDKGVHALGQTVNFYSNTTIDLGNLPKVINYHLPGDISVMGAKYAEEDFHSRYSAKKKFYRYIIYRGKYRNPLYENRAYHFPYTLDLDKMRKSMECLIGEHDFKSFMGRHAVVKDTIRTINKIEITEKGELVYIDFYGKSFLKNMVRVLVGTAIEIGTNHRDVDFMNRALIAQKRTSAGPTAPSCGLYLMKIYY
ncbi:tRNA pseudouridine(38-40) synthase TruA [Peptoniphilus stercorisuis]|uniref:tRNA pseudouridine synthase A n=1 Tax=Peptoniphilus stercorisuis TaxID=1436965 RepID=A0ABS4KA85_9FIRM|nr:tRNA pseudouridine(38-40) synthase TruA [Peptoniphilus stercorisuis]MBP2024687.1 tRNA pseudouridine38-40 synthase [Peptoniphilus stercorisuis]